MAAIIWHPDEDKILQKHSSTAAIMEELAAHPEFSKHNRTESAIHTRRGNLRAKGINVTPGTGRYSHMGSKKKVTTSNGTSKGLSVYLNGVLTVIKEGDILTSKMGIRLNRIIGEYT